MTQATSQAETAHELDKAQGRREASSRAATTLTWVFLAAALAWAWGPAEMSRWTYLFTDSGNMAEYAKGFLRPDFADWRFYVEEMVVTLQIALWGTALAFSCRSPSASCVRTTWPPGGCCNRCAG